MRQDAEFQEFYEANYGRIVAMVAVVLGDRHQAEDVAQEAFARAWKALPRFAGERRFYPWLTVIAGSGTAPSAMSGPDGTTITLPSGAPSR